MSLFSEVLRGVYFGTFLDYFRFKAAAGLEIQVCGVVS